MGLYKDLDVSFSDTVKAGYHRIVEFSFNSITGACLVQVQSYVSKADADAGKAPVLSRGLSLNVTPSVELYADIQALLEAAILAQSSEFEGATIG